MLWLTPQMDRLFLDGATGRRAFLDRLVFALEPSHARAVAAHDRAVASRNRLLAQGRFDPSWAAGLEDEIARHAVAVAALRADLAARLNNALAGDAAGGFPAAAMIVRCAIGDRLARMPALAVEQWLRDELRGRRQADQASGRTSVGAHRADMELRDRVSGITAAHASTGQQKSLLVGVVLGHAALIEAARGIPPMLLLDEAAAHLDAEHRAALVGAAGRLNSQIILTGTDPSAYRGLRDETCWFEVAENAISYGRGGEIGV
jgi:DNA replication and repair protein RecF